MCVFKTDSRARLKFDSKMTLNDFFPMEGRGSLPTSSNRQCSSWSRFILTAVCVVLLARPSLQDNYIFETQPERYYYQVVGKAILIPCKAVLERDDGSTQITSPTLLVNSEPVDIYARDTRYYAWATDGEVSGLLLTPVMVEDSGKTVECAVIVNNQTEVSVQTIIYVGDGTPLAPTSDPVQTSDSLYSVTIDWGESPHPTRDPLQGYTLLLTELLEVEREIRFESFSNNTNAEIPNLKAGVEYRVVVFGRNQMGEGQRSHYVVARTVSPTVPYPPTNVAVTLEIGNTSSNIILYWTPTPIEPDIMTPITDYIVFYGVQPSTLRNVTIQDSSASTYNISGLTKGGNFSVGVSAVNSAGQSEIAFTLSEIVVPRPPSTAEPIQLETIVVTVAAIVVGLLIILSVMIIICCLRHRNKRLDAETFDLPAIEELDGSPSIKKKSPKSSPKHLNGASAIDYSLNSTELQSYGDEPRRPGSRSPPPADSIINAEQNLTSVTFR